MEDEIRPEGGYAPRQQHLHWIVAGLVMVQLMLGAIIGTTQPVDHRVVLWVHAAVGSTIFALTLTRWRLRQRVGAPSPPSGTPDDAALLAHINHLGYYVLLFALPVLGWCAYLFSSSFRALHAAGAGLLLIAIAAHLGGVIYHRWFRHDDLLQRMLPAHPAAGNQSKRVDG